MTANKTAMLLVAACLVATGLRAAEQGHGKAHAKVKEAKGQTNCPVMGGKVNKDLYVDAHGKRIYVCCKGCIGAIKKSPAKYIKKLEDQGVTLARLQTNCPVMGGKVNKDLYVDAHGKRIYICCKGCIPAIRKDPGKYIKKLEEQGVTVADVPDVWTCAMHPQIKQPKPGKCPICTMDLIPAKQEPKADGEHGKHDGHKH